MQTNNKFDNVIENSIKSLNDIIDVNTIIGKPIFSADNSIIFPVSKVTFGVLSGGGEYGKINIFQNNNDLPYSTGNGTIVSIKPCGFLVQQNKNFKFITTKEEKFEKLVDKFSDFLENINNEKDN